MTNSIALMYWYGRYLPKDELPENPQPLEVYVSKQTLFSPRDPQFLTVVIATIERTFGSAPNIDEKFFDPHWYEDMPENLDWKQVEINCNFKVIEYEAACYDILWWLKLNGDIRSLKKM